MPTTSAQIETRRIAFFMAVPFGTGVQELKHRPREWLPKNCSPSRPTAREEGHIQRPASNGAWEKHLPRDLRDYFKRDWLSSQSRPRGQRAVRQRAAQSQKRERFYRS